VLQKLFRYLTHRSVVAVHAVIELAHGGFRKFAG
jgi:hypothetical protein